MRKYFNPLIKWLLVIWLFCLAVDIGIFIVVIFIREELFYTTPSYLAIPFLSLFVIGCISFIGGLLGFTFTYITKSKGNKKNNNFVKILKFVFILAFFPVFIAFKRFEPIKAFIKVRKIGIKGSYILVKKSYLRLLTRTFISVFVLTILFPIWVVGYAIFGVMIAESLGYNPTPIPIAGTGSMYPTFPKSHEKDPVKQFEDVIGVYDFTPFPNGIFLFGKRYFGYELHRGDIVVAENETIWDYGKKLYGVPSGVVKRIIGMPGDTIEIRNGIVSLNDKPLQEPYTYKPHSTFGGTFLEECKKLTIPENKFFIMGDNRKGSGDSREFGLVDIDDIRSVISFESQKDKYDSHYRDITKDLNDSSKIRLNKEIYLEHLNQKRIEEGLKPLRYQKLLEKSAQKRGEAILEYNDFSFEATSSGMTMKKAMSSVGYSNIVWGEAPTQGYYEADELLENQFEYPVSKKFLLEKDYQEIGIAEVEGELNGCPTQVIIQHLAGYIPPNYNKADVEGWRNSLNRLKEIQPSWQQLKNSTDFYQSHKQDIDRINEIIAVRISNMESVVSKMESNRWLNKQEIDYTYRDEQLYIEQESLAENLNNF